MVAVKDPMYRQCNLARQLPGMRVVLITWLPEKFAVMDKNSDLMRNRFDTSRTKLLDGSSHTSLLMFIRRQLVGCPEASPKLTTRKRLTVSHEAGDLIKLPCFSLG